MPAPEHNRNSSEYSEESDVDNKLSRRKFLKTAGLGTLAAGVGVAAGGQTTNYALRQVIQSEDKGSRRQQESITGMATQNTLDISDGEDIGSYLSNVSDGETIVIPEGTYKFSGASLSGNNWTVRGNGAKLKPTGTTLLRLNGSGWDFGGFHIDQSGSGNRLKAMPSGTDWNFHNLAWTGTHSNSYVITPQVTSSNSSATIGHLYCDLGSELHSTENWDKLAWMNYDHHGEIWWRYIWSNGGGVYGTHSARKAFGTDMGTTNFEGCYFDSNNIHSIRTGHPTKTSYVRDCVIVVEPERVPKHIHGVKNARGIWSWYGKTVVENTDIAQNGPWYAAVSHDKFGYAGSIEMRGGNITGNTGSRVSLSNVGDNPSTGPPEGCPTSVEEAVKGVGRDGSNSGRGSSGEVLTSNRCITEIESDEK